MKVDLQFFYRTFYSAMHFSAKRGIYIACRLSVSPPVCNVGGSGSHRLEILEKQFHEQLAQHFRFSIYLLAGEHGEILGRKGWEKWSTWRKSYYGELRVYRNSPTLFRMIPTPTPCGLLFPKIGGLQPPKIQSLLSQE